MDRELVTNLIKGSETLYLKVHGYGGKQLIGWGCDLKSESSRTLCWTARLHMDRLRSGDDVLTLDQAEALFQAQLNRAIEDTKSVVGPRLSMCGEMEQAVLVDAMYTMGLHEFCAVNALVYPFLLRDGVVIKTACTACGWSRVRNWLILLGVDVNDEACDE